MSSYTWLYPSTGANSEAATNAIGEWISSFESMQWLVTDQGLHLVALLATSLTNEIKGHHHFTIAYCPWANGTIKCLCKVLKVVRASLSEWKLPAVQRPSIIEAVKIIINHSSSRKLGRHSTGSLRCSTEVLRGLTPSPLILRLMPMKTYRTLQALNEEKAH